MGQWLSFFFAFSLFFWGISPGWYLPGGVPAKRYHLGGVTPRGYPQGWVTPGGYPRVEPPVEYTPRGKQREKKKKRQKERK